MRQATERPVCVKFLSHSIRFANTCLVSRRQQLVKQAGDLQRSGVSEQADTSSSSNSPPSTYLPGAIVAGEARGRLEPRARHGCGDAGAALKDGGSGGGRVRGKRHWAGSDAGRAGGYCCCGVYALSQLAAAENAGSARCAMFKFRPSPSLQPLPSRSPSTWTRAPGCKRPATPPSLSRCGRPLVRTWKCGNPEQRTNRGF